MITIFTDTSANLPYLLTAENGIGVIPFSYTVNGEEQLMKPDTDFNGKLYYNAMRDGAEIKTSMINPERFRNAFEKEMMSGNDVIYLAMSGGISGTAAAAGAVAEELSEKYKDRSVEVIDTLGASLGEGLLALKAAQMRNGGVSFKDIVRCIKDERRRMCQFFTVEDLKYLKKAAV